MNILGIAFDYHDSGVALAKDGRITRVGLEERHSFIKHDRTFPILAAKGVLAEERLGVDKIDEVAYYEEPSLKYLRLLDSSIKGYPNEAKFFLKFNKSWLQRKLWVRSVISNRLKVAPSRVNFVPHHVSHLSQAFLASPFSEAAVVVVDAVGEVDCTTIAMAKRSESRFYDIKKQFKYPNSLGLIYSAFTAFLGFQPNSGEASTMALAAFGEPKYADKIRKVLKIYPDGDYEVQPEFFFFKANSKNFISPVFLKLFGEPRQKGIPYHFNALEPGDVPREDQYFADIAASFQLVFEEALLSLCSYARKISGSKNLCLAGGVALNCLANTKIMKESGFEHFYIPPDPGDGGAAFGAALYQAHRYGETHPVLSPYLGRSYDLKKFRDIVGRSPKNHRIAGKEISAEPSAFVEVRHFDRTDQYLDLIASELTSGKVVGLYKDCYEIGPRALGNRSIVVDPANLLAVKKLNAIKEHSKFRPYALSIAAEDADHVLETDFLSENTLKWMQTIWPVKDGLHDTLRGGVHIDGTTRPQICSKEDNYDYWLLLREVGKKTGSAALLNTSFNRRSFPVVSCPIAALSVFCVTGMDVLVVNHTVLRKIYS